MTYKNTEITNQSFTESEIKVLKDIAKGKNVIEQELNSEKDTATNAMCTFLAINTSSVQLILPATVVALMGAAANQIFITTILATGMSTVAAIFAVKFFEKLNRFKMDSKESND